MNAPHPKTELALSAADVRRLEKLAREAGRTPRAMLRFVLRDGFDYTEEVVRKAKEGLADLDAGNRIPHAEAMAQLNAALSAKHAGRPGKAA